jgi:hypothetical protein
MTFHDCKTLHCTTRTYIVAWKRAFVHAPTILCVVTGRRSFISQQKQSPSKERKKDTYQQHNPRYLSMFTIAYVHVEKKGENSIAAR